MVSGEEQGHFEYEVLNSFFFFLNAYLFAEGGSKESYIGLRHRNSRWVVCD